MSIYKFSEIQRQMNGWWDDFVGIDRTIIERNACPACRKPLEYQAFANATESKAFGVCRECDYARLFYATSSQFAQLKQVFSRREAVKTETVN